MKMKTIIMSMNMMLIFQLYHFKYFFLSCDSDEKGKSQNGSSQMSFQVWRSSLNRSMLSKNPFAHSQRKLLFDTLQKRFTKKKKKKKFWKNPVFESFFNEGSHSLATLK